MTKLTDTDEPIPFITNVVDWQPSFERDYIRSLQRRSSVSAESVDPNEYNEEFLGIDHHALHPPPSSTSRKVILNRLRTMLIFADLHLDVLAEIVSFFTEERFSEGTEILSEFKVGELADKFHVIESGNASVSSGGKVFAQIGPGASFNEVSLLHDSTNTLTIKAITDVKAWALHRVPFKEIMAHQSIKKRNFLKDIIRRTEPLYDLDQEDQMKIVDGLQSVFFDANEIIMKEGEEAANFYIISKGEVLLCIKGVPIISLGRGNIFGEFALLGQSFNVVTAIARTKVQLEKLDKYGFERLLGEQKANDFRNKARVLCEGKVLPPTLRTV